MKKFLIVLVLALGLVGCPGEDEIQDKVVAARLCGETCANYNADLLGYDEVFSLSTDYWDIVLQKTGKKDGHFTGEGELCFPSEVNTTCYSQCEWKYNVYPDHGWVRGCGFSIEWEELGQEL